MHGHTFTSQYASGSMSVEMQIKFGENHVQAPIHYTNCRVSTNNVLPCECVPKSLAGNKGQIDLCYVMHVAHKSLCSKVVAMEIWIEFKEHRT